MYEDNVVEDMKKIQQDIVMAIGLSDSFINKSDVFKW